MFALPGPAPQNIQLSGQGYRLVKIFKHDFWAATCLYEAEPAATGQEGNFQTRHRVYGRQGQPCPRCHAPIQRISAAGRSTHLCPSCQVLGLAVQSLRLPRGSQP